MSLSFLTLLGQAEAQLTGPAANGSTQNPLASMIPFVLIFVVFYFFMIRPQKKKMDEEQAMINALGKGDEVYTKAGLIGTIAGLTEKVITLEVSEGVKVKVLRSQIAGLAKKIFEATEKK